MTRRRVGSVKAVATGPVRTKERGVSSTGRGGNSGREEVGREQRWARYLPVLPFAKDSLFILYLDL